MRLKLTNGHVVVVVEGLATAPAAKMLAAKGENIAYTYR